MDVASRRALSGAQLRHWSPSSPRLDETAEPLIAPGSVVGFWPLEHWLAVPWHDHAFYEVAFVVQGSGYHFAGDHETRIEAGSVIFVPPGTAHGYRALRDVAVYNCFFRAELAEFELLWASRDSGLGPLIGHSGRGARSPGEHLITHLEPDDLRACVNELERMRRTPSSERSHAREIGHLLLALDLIAQRGVPATPSAPAPSALAPRAVNQAAALMERDLSRRWSLTELAAAVFVNPHYLVHQFTRWMGISPVAYGMRRRLDRAAFLLSGTDQSIAAIGREVGWPEPAAFSHQFHAAFGVSPSEYRRRARPVPVGPGTQE